ncbi:MAG TPA: hypothetical protein VK764_09120 [Terracidiphilus sp.]|nr:hypothetical protein [Terracidiphilus sp.]
MASLRNRPLRTLPVYYAMRTGWVGCTTALEGVLGLMWTASSAAVNTIVRGDPGSLVRWSASWKSNYRA